MLDLLNSLITDIYDKHLINNCSNKDMLYTKIAMYNLQTMNIKLKDDFINQNINLTVKFL